MASEITYAEVNFKNGSKSSGTNSASPAAPKERTTPHKSNPGFPKLLYPSLLILFLLLAISFCIAFIEKVWSCCPKNWRSFSSKCYFISTEAKSWHESEENCSRMGAHLLVINTKDEQDFITQNLEINHFALFLWGLSDPEGSETLAMGDQTPYTKCRYDPKERCCYDRYFPLSMRLE
uniref:C-type lectin domain family 4 member A n=1 Tax=Microcebus murinus TaxID=30608 RepID=A0A8C5XTL1_MICMU